MYNVRSIANSITLYEYLVFLLKVHSYENLPQEKRVTMKYWLC